MSGAAWAGDDIDATNAALATNPPPPLVSAHRGRRSAMTLMASSGVDAKSYVYQATGDLRTTTSGSDITLYFDVTEKFAKIEEAYISLMAYDVDYPVATENDITSLNGHSLGWLLQGGNNQWHSNDYIPVKSEYIIQPNQNGESARNTFFVDVDARSEGWVTCISTATLTIKGKAGIEVDATDGTDPEGVRVTWKSVGDGATYTLYRGEAKGAKDKRLYGGTDLEFLDEEAEPGKVYFYTVEAVVGSGSVSSSGMQLLAASGETITGDNDGYYEKPPVITGIKFAKLFLTETGPYNIKLEWNDYKEDIYQIDQIEFTFEGVGAASGKKQSGIWNTTSTLSKIWLTEELDLSAKAKINFPSGEHGEYKVKIKWEATNKETGKKVTSYYENGEQKQLEFDAPDTAKVYFKKWDNDNWWVFWKRDEAIKRDKVKDVVHQVCKKGKAGGMFSGNAQQVKWKGMRPAEQLTIMHRTSLGSWTENFYLPMLYHNPQYVLPPIEVFDLAASAGESISDLGVGASAQGIFNLGVVIAHEQKHREIFLDRYQGRYCLKDLFGRDIDAQTIDVTEDLRKIKEWLDNDSAAYDSELVTSIREYYDKLKAISENPKAYLTSDEDNDGVRDDWERDNGLFTTGLFASDTHMIYDKIRAGYGDDLARLNDPGLTEEERLDLEILAQQLESYRKTGDNEYLARSAESAGMGKDYVDDDKDWAFPGCKIAKDYMGFNRDKWGTVENNAGIKALEHVDAGGGSATTSNAGGGAKLGKRLLASSPADVDNVKELGRALSGDWTSSSTDYASGATVLGATAGTATGEGGNGFSELDFTVTVSNSTESAGTYRVTGYLVDESGKGVAVAYAGLGLAGNAVGTVSLRFAGEYIHGSRRNGYSLALVTVEDFSTDMVSCLAAKNNVASCDRTYSYSEFAHDVVVVVGNFSDSLNGRNIDVSFDVEADSQGDYSAYGLLKGPDGKTYVATATTAFSNTGRVTLSFPGDEIYTSGCEGKFVLESLQIRDADGTQIVQQWNACETASYERSQFRPESVVLTVDESSFACSTACGEDGLIDALNISFDVSNSSGGALSYRIEVNVYGTNDHYAASVSKTVSIVNGASTLALSLDGSRISASGVDGPYRVYDVRLTPLGETGNVERFFPDMEAMELKAHDFGAYPFKLNGAVRFYQNSTGIGCGLYVPLTIQRANTVTVSAMLVDASGQFVAMATGSRTYTEPCEDTISISFSEHDILASERKGPYSVRFVQIASDIAGVVPLRAEVPAEAKEISTSYTRYVDRYAGGAEVDGYSWNTAFRDIQSAVDAANDGDLVLVADGTYAPFETHNKSIEIRSVNGWRNAEIDANDEKRCATLGFGESHTNTVLVGFTLAYGDASTAATLTLWNCGGGVCGGTLRNCRITSCTASKGGGAYYSRLENCLVDHNTASTYGGGTYGCVAVNCTIANNGVESGSPSSGGGVYLGGCWNSIVYDNYGNYYDDDKGYASNYAECELNFCSTRPLPESGVGNSISYPYFNDPDNGDYSLGRYSYCIDIGLTSIAPGDKDLGGGARVCDGVVDLGAFEFQTHSYSDGECGFRESDEKGGESGTLSIPVWGGHPDHASSVKVYVVPCTATTADLNLGKAKPPLVIKWSAGEVGTKYLKIPLKKDSIVEGSESLSIVLGSASGMTLTENRAIKLTIDDATSSVTLAEALNNVKLKPSTGGDGKWKPVEGRLAYRYESHVRPVFADSPALKTGKSSTLNLGTFKGKGRLCYRFMFYGDESGFSSKTKLQVFDGKVKYSPHTAASVPSGWNYSYLDLGSGTHKISLKVTQGDAYYARVRVTDVAWIPAGKTPFFTNTDSWPEAGGVVVGGGMHPSNTVLTLKAKVRSGWRFNRWYRHGDWAVVGTNATLKVTAGESEGYYAEFAELNTVRVLPYPAEGGTVSGGGFYANGKTATLKAQPAKNYYLEGWYPADADDPNKMHKNKFCSYGNASTLKRTVYEDETYFANFLPCPKLTLTTANVNGGTVKGTGQYQPGKTATLKATPKKGYAFTGWYDEDGNLVSLSAVYKYKMTADGVSFTAKFKKESALAKPTLTWGDYVVGGDNGESTSTSLTAGVVYSAGLTMEGESATVISKVSGLPKGLTYKSGKVSGVPTKAGKYAVTVTVALASNKKKVWTYKVPLNVAALPAWARGTFYGWTHEDLDYYKRKVTFSVTSAGKISAKVGSLAFSRTGWTVDEAGSYVATMRTVRTTGIGRGKRTYTDVLTLSLSGPLPWTEANQLSGCIFTFNGNVSLAKALAAIEMRKEEGMQALVDNGTLPVPINADIWVYNVRRNSYGDNAEAKALAAELAALGTLSITDAEGVVWNLNVAANGVAKIWRTTGTGRYKKTTSATAVVEWDGEGTIPQALFLVSGRIIGFNWQGYGRW